MFSICSLPQLHIISTVLKWLLNLFEKIFNMFSKANPSSMGSSLGPMTSRQLQHNHLVILWSTLMYVVQISLTMVVYCLGDNQIAKACRFSPRIDGVA